MSSTIKSCFFCIKEPYTVLCSVVKQQEAVEHETSVGGNMKRSPFINRGLFSFTIIKKPLMFPRIRLIFSNQTLFPKRAEAKAT